MNTPFTLYDATTGQIRATGSVRGGWSANAPPGQVLLLGRAATATERVDVAAGEIVPRSPLLAQQLYSIPVGALVLTLPVPCSVRYDDAVVGVLAAGGDTIQFPTAGTFSLTLVDPTGLYLDAHITVVVT